MTRKRVLIMGAAGRDFHNFNVVFRDDGACEVVAFTAAQIPGIAERRYPPELAGPLYPMGIPIHPEERLEELIESLDVNEVVFSYSDVSHEDVMHRASRAIAKGADFRLLSAKSTMLRSTRPVVSVCAVRTGCGKSPAVRRVAEILRDEGRRVAIVRHPMPYGDLARQAVQRFATLDDLNRHECTIEEIEEYEPHIRAGQPVFAGVDYARILRCAESEADVIVWDGGNNDTPFFVPDLELVLVDPHRAGHERTYHPGEVNLRRAQVVIVAKEDTADPAQIETVCKSVREVNPRAMLVHAAMPVTVEDPSLVRGRRVLVVEDGPTLTHGGMAYGAGMMAARKYGAAEVVSPRAVAVGSVRRTLEEYPHLSQVLPAVGYGAEQMRDLEETIRRVACDTVLIATPADLRRLMSIRQHACRASYELAEVGAPTLRDVLRKFMIESPLHVR